MSTPVIMQGDDTAANGRSLVLQLPGAQIGGEYEVAFDLCGVERSGQYVPGGTVSMDFTAEETAAFPLGVQLGVLRLRKGGLSQTISNTVPVLVTDCVARAEAAALSGNAINLAVKVNTTYVPVAAEELTQASTIAELRAAVNAILAALAGTQ